MKKLFLLLTFYALLTSPAWGVTYTDSFSQGDEYPLSSSGAWQGGYTGFDSFQVVSNRLRVGLEGLDVRMTVASAVPGASQYAQIALPTFNTSAYFIAGELLLRWSAPSTATGIEVVILGGTYFAEQRVAVYDIVDGIESQLGTWIVITFSPGDVFKATVSGDTVTVYQNNTPLNPTFTTSILSAGRIGLGGFSWEAVPDIELDDFEGGDLGAPPTVGIVKRRPIVLQ